MKIPKSINICGQIYKVKVRAFGAIEGDTDGYTIINGNEIGIDERLNQSQQESTLIHEIIEVINAQYEIKLPHYIIRTLETALYQVLNDNKLLK